MPRRKTIATLALWFIVTISSSVAAQEAFQQQTPMRLGQHRIVSQPNLQQRPPLVEQPTVAVPPQIQQTPSAVQLKTQARYVDDVRRTDYQTHASHTSSSPGRDDWQRVLESSSAAADTSPTMPTQSFIEREKASGKVQRKPAQVLISKIAINLGFVLAIAIGFILLAKQWQKGKLQPPSTAAPENSDALRLRQSLTLAGGISLHVVEGFSNQFLVAIDSAGIKTVKVLSPSFDETMEQTTSIEQPLETTEPTPEPPMILSARIPIVSELKAPNADTEKSIKKTTAEPAESRRSRMTRLIDEESSTEIDEKLIKLLLRSSQSAA